MDCFSYWIKNIKTAKDNSAKGTKDNLKRSREKIDSFKNGYGTILYFYYYDIVEDLKNQYKTYAEKFEDWASQSSAMLQLRESKIYDMDFHQRRFMLQRLSLETFSQKRFKTFLILQTGTSILT